MRSTSARWAGRACRIISACGDCGWRSVRGSISTRTSAPCVCSRGWKAPCATRRAKTWIGSSCGRTPKGSTPGSAGATSSGAARARRSPCRRGCSPPRAASASSATLSISPAPAPASKVTSVTKSNAQQYGMVLWDETFARVAQEYPDVETEQWLVDAMAARFVLRPDTLSVVVASNLFADILSDLGSALAGSLGIAASANLDPLHRYPSMFEPVHGSAPDIAGQGIANPIGAIWSAALMLDHLGFPEAGRTDRGCDRSGNCRPPRHPRPRRHLHHPRSHRRHPRTSHRERATVSE